MNYYQFAEAFANQQKGRTCLISRVKEQSNLNINQSFCTLHSLAYKILRRSNTFQNANCLNGKLSGDSTFNNVKFAIKKSLNEDITEDQALEYYYRLREHQNSGRNINSLQSGATVLHEYQFSKGNTMDWEESMQLATWYLNEEMVHSIDRFDYNNIILLQPDLLKRKSNKNALDFFQAFCKWSDNYTNWNIYLINRKGEVYHYQDTNYKIIKYKDDCQLQSSLFVG